MVETGASSEFEGADRVDAVVAGFAVILLDVAPDVEEQTNDAVLEELP